MWRIKVRCYGTAPDGRTGPGRKRRAPVSRRRNRAPRPSDGGVRGDAGRLRPPPGQPQPQTRYPPSPRAAGPPAPGVHRRLAVAVDPGALRALVGHTPRGWPHAGADARYQWPRVCEQYFGSFPAQVCHELNRIRHTTDYEGHPDGNRPLSKQELTRLFEVANQRPAQACRLGRKGELAAHRDAALLLTILGWGLRRTEASWLNVTDWRRNPAHPQFGRFGQLVVRRGKSARGSPPRRRVVLTVFPWSVTAVETYLAEVRPRFVDRYPDTGAMFPTERGQRIMPKQINARFASLREEAGLDRHLGPHCLRHTYITTLLERGWPLALVQEHFCFSDAATTE